MLPVQTKRTLITLSIRIVWEGAGDAFQSDMPIPRGQRLVVPRSDLHLKEVYAKPDECNSFVTF